MFTTLIAQPIFNLLVAIYALLPGHNFGLAIIIFTIIIRLLLWPLLKKQLHQTKVMRKVQPELKKIKQQTKGDRQKEAQLTMELYKERGIKPMASIGVVLLQLPILLALYSGLNRVIKDPHQLHDFAYPFLQDLSWMQQLGQNIHLFDESLLGVVDLTKSAIGANGLYLPALVLVLGSVFVQFFQSRQLLPQAKDGRSLRSILKDAGSGKQTDQSEVNAAVGRSTMYFLPIMIFFFTVSLASALSLYWLVGGLVAYMQQSYILREDETEMEALADVPSKNVKDIPEAEIVAQPQATPTKPHHKNKKNKSRKKRRK
jgi:YidC/Oxa1 family membrane protein insertase